MRLADVAVASFGASEAPVTLVEFTDYQCPFCKRFHEQTWPELKRVYVDSGKVRLVVRDLPLTFTLDDSMAMSPAAKLSGATQVTIGARISKSGTAIAQPGDLAGETTGVVPGATAVAVRIGSVVGKP